MSNALCAASIVSLLSQVQPATAPLGQPAAAPADVPGLPAFVMGLVAAGMCLLGLWITARIVRPTKFSLRASPGRPTSLNPAHLVAVLLLVFGATGLMQALMGDSKAPRPMVIRELVTQVVWLASSLVVAAMTFTRGLSRGLGLSLRRWVLDTVRGAWALLAVLPVALGLLLGAQAILRAQGVQVEEHPNLTMAVEVKGPWLVALLVSTVVLAPLTEEIFFRGLLQSLVRRYTHRPWVAVVVASAIFALLHVESGADSPHTFMQVLGMFYAVPSLLVLGLALGYNYERTGRLWAPMVTHALFNALNIGLKLAGY